jgi:hypothetical protein
MDFKELQETVPLVRYGKEKCLEMKPYANITLAMPGRHAEETTPKGGDFVVMVTDGMVKWKRHQFKHSDLFDDIQVKWDNVSTRAELDVLMEAYYAIVNGEDPNMQVMAVGLPGIQSNIFYQAVQCLAVAEHRRYAQHEAKFGGRFLPFRFVAGIAEGLWSADAGTEVQKYGRPAVEKLEKKHGTPLLTARLMGV